MNPIKVITEFFRKYVPSPFTIAVLLTLGTMMFALVFTDNTSNKNHFVAILSY